MRPPWLIVGSTALVHWFPDFKRKPLDVDLLTPTKTIGTSGVVDCQWHDAAEYLIQNNSDPTFADPNTLLTLKVSHANWPIKWEKTMFDIRFLKEKGATLDLELWKRLNAVWVQIHGKKRINTTIPLEDFFKDAVKRDYDHEYLHELVAFNGRPMHERLRPDFGVAWCDQEKFYSLTEEERLETILEELMATAIERYRLREGASINQMRASMSKAYYSLCTSMSGTWFARHSIFNQHELLNQRKEKWTTMMKTALKELHLNPQNRRLLPSQTRSPG